MKKRVVDWYFKKIVVALNKSEIRWELHPRAGKRQGSKIPICQGYSQRHDEGKWLIVIRYRPSSVNSMYVLIHEAIHLAFPDWPERYCWGEPVDLQTGELLREFSDNQTDILRSYLPGR